MDITIKGLWKMVCEADSQLDDVEKDLERVQETLAEVYYHLERIEDD